MMFAIYSQVPGDRRESATCWNRSQDPGGICCPDLQVHRDFLWVHSSQWQNLESHTCWAEPAWREQEFSFQRPPFSRPNTVLKECGEKEMRSLCNLQVCHLVASFYSASSSQGFSLHALQDGGALLFTRLVRKDAGATPSEDPHLSCLWNWGWTTCQQATLSPLLGDLGLQYLHLSLLWGSSTASCGL